MSIKLALALREQHRLRIFGSKRAAVTERRKKLHNELHNLYLTGYYQGNQIKENSKVGTVSSM
jgi:hypothetical protein